MLKNSDKSLNIFVLTYNKPILDIVNDDWHTPLQVGAAVTGINICGTKDNTAENISTMNPFCSELTGIYWAWKNAQKTDYIGFEAYRRHFNLNKELVLDILADHDIILPTPINLGKETNKEFYNRVNIGKDFDAVGEIIKESYPEYAEDWEKYLVNGRLLYYGNGFVTSYENFTKMAEFIFGILDRYMVRMGFQTLGDVRKYVEESKQTMMPLDHMRQGMTPVDYQMKIGAFLTERLITLYALHNFSKIYHVKYEDLDGIYRKIETRTLLCTIGRVENRYAREFVEYYKELGVDNICLYDNNRDGEEDFRDVIGDYIDSGYVILKDYRNREKCQLEAYNECYKEYGQKYTWIMFFDMDEFLFLNVGPTVRDYLTRKEFDAYDMIHVNWLGFGDDGQVHYEDKPVQNRIIHALPVDHKVLYDFPENFHVKSIVRGNLQNVTWDKTSHTPTIDGKCCNATGIPCDKNSPFTPYDFRMAGLRHFSTKTAEEYADKVLKGFPDGNPITREKMVSLFFKKNEPTMEKIQIFKDKLGIDMTYLLPSSYEGEKRKDIQIFSLCYARKDFAFLNDAVITPLQVGAANGTDVCALKDNTGDNISAKNYFFIENTGTYWIWKNIKDAQYKGQMQYRRPLEGIDENTDFETIFKDHDVITCEPFHHPSHKTPTKEQPMAIPADTVEQGYAFSNCIDDLYILEMVVKMNYPDYTEDWDKYIKKGPNLYYSNGFIMKAEDYDRYSEFLFKNLLGYLDMAGIHTPKDLVDHVRYNIEVGKYIRYEDPRAVPQEAIKWQTEIGGFLSERLWTLWLQHNFKEDRVYKLPYIKMENNMFT